MADLNLVAGDKYPAITLTLKDKNTGDPRDPDTWSAIDLSDANDSVRIDYYNDNSGTPFATNTTTKVGGGSTGQVTFFVATAVLAAEFEGEAEVVIVHVDGTETVFDRLTVLVRSR